MNDAHNLSKLLKHASPSQFKAAIEHIFEVSLPAIQPEHGKRETREAFTAHLSALAIAQRQRLEGWAEQITVLTDGAGLDAIDSIRFAQWDALQNAAFEQLENQYDRSLWLYSGAPDLFKEAHDARMADIFRQSTSCYSGFMAPPNLKLLNDEASTKSFLIRFAAHLNCAIDEVAIEIFTRLRPDAHTGDEVTLYQVSVHHNLAPEAIDFVKKSKVESQRLIRATSAYITYEPDNGYLEVLSKDKHGREALARMVAHSLLKSSFNADPIPLKYYDYQFLASPCQLDISGESITSAVVTQLGYGTHNGRSLSLKIGIRDPDTIYQASKDVIGPHFNFSDHTINFAQVSIKTRKIGRERARTLHIILRGENGCNIKTKREKDRQLCDHLLEKWNIVRELPNEIALAANDT